jgi:hypothetical protein
VFAKLVSHNEDLHRLGCQKGYAVAFEPGYLIVRDVSYLDHERQSSNSAAIVAKLVIVNEQRS